MKNKSGAGFTLIELLVVMIVLLSVGTIIGVILFSSLRGANKTNAITILRQNGNFAISQMTKTIRSAKQFDGVRPVGGSIYSTNCTIIAPPTPTPTPVQTRYDSIKITTSTDEQITFTCDGSTVKSNSVSLFDQITISIEPDSCFFTCVQSDLSSAPTIGINFTLTARLGQSFEQRATPVNFSTSVTLRNVPR